MKNSVRQQNNFSREDLQEILDFKYVQRRVKIKLKRNIALWDVQSRKEGHSDLMPSFYG